MELQAVATLHRIAQTAPPPPMRHRIQVPTEPLLFAAIILTLTIGIAKSMSQPTSNAVTVTNHPAATQPA